MSVILMTTLFYKHCYYKEKFDADLRAYRVKLSLQSTPQIPLTRNVESRDNLGFWETAHLPLPQAIILTEVRGKC